MPKKKKKRASTKTFTVSRIDTLKPFGWYMPTPTTSEECDARKHAACEDRRCTCGCH